MKSSRLFAEEVAAGLGGEREREIIRNDESLTGLQCEDTLLCNVLLMRCSCVAKVLRDCNAKNLKTHCYAKAQRCVLNDARYVLCGLVVSANSAYGVSS